MPGSLDLGEVTMVMPGDTVDLTVQLGSPVALDVGLGFAVREGGRTVAAGTVTALLDWPRTAQDAHPDGMRHRCAHGCSPLTEDGPQRMLG